MRYIHSREELSTVVAEALAGLHSSAVYHVTPEAISRTETDPNRLRVTLELGRYYKAFTVPLPAFHQFAREGVRLAVQQLQEWQS